MLFRSPSAFGYGKGEFRTDVRAMRHHSTVLYARREFQIDQVDRLTEIGLLVDFSDAFIAYINGREVARSGVGRGSGRNAQKVTPRDQKGGQFFPLPDALKHLQDGANVLTIEAHNSSVDKAEFLMNPSLILED